MVFLMRHKMVFHVPHHVFAVSMPTLIYPILAIIFNSMFLLFQYLHWYFPFYHFLVYDILEHACSYFHQNSDVGITEVLEMLLDKRTKYLYFFHVNIFEYSLSFKNLSNQMQYNICFLRGAHRRFVIFSVVIKEKCREMICW